MIYQGTKDSFRRLKLLISEFVRKSPVFEGDEELAKCLATEIAHLEFLIYEYSCLALNKP